jgi:hypothetical protein
MFSSTLKIACFIICLVPQAVLCAATPIGQVFPANNPWNIDISGFPVHARSANYVTSIGSGTSLHPDFGTVLEGVPWGIPYVVVSGTQPRVAIHFTAYGDESDPGPYPVPANAPVEGGLGSDGDRHVIVIDRDNRKLYELFSAYPRAGGTWDAACGAIFDLTSNALRPDGWTSADAAGLPVFPGLVRYDEVAAGAINHALRFTVVNSQKAYVYPARHYASSKTDVNLPPMGLRFRLKAGVDISALPPQARIIATALKRYGMMVADNGGNWFLSGAPDPQWDDDAINTLKRLKGSDFEAVDTSSLAANPTPPPPAIEAHINFQPAAAPIHAGYLVDSGKKFANRGNGFSYGWNDSNAYAIDRNLPASLDQRYDTFNYMQKADNPKARWHIAVPNGSYQVRVVAGDPKGIGSIYKIAVEGVLAVDMTPNASAHWAEATVTVAVSDGKLTISSAAGAKNNKLCFVDIVQVPAADPKAGG